MGAAQSSGDPRRTINRAFLRKVFFESQPEEQLARINAAGDICLYDSSMLSKNEKVSNYFCGRQTRDSNCAQMPNQRTGGGKQCVHCADLGNLKELEPGKVPPQLWVDLLPAVRPATAKDKAKILSPAELDTWFQVAKGSPEVPAASTPEFVNVPGLVRMYPPRENGRYAHGKWKLRTQAAHPEGSVELPGWGQNLTYSFCVYNIEGQLSFFHPQATQGEWGRFFCGQTIGAELPGMDGSCGPTAGLQCGACFLIDHVPIDADECSLAPLVFRSRQQLGRRLQDSIVHDAELAVKHDCIIHRVSTGSWFGQQSIDFSLLPEKVVHEVDFIFWCLRFKLPTHVVRHIVGYYFELTPELAFRLLNPKAVRRDYC